MRPQCDGAAAKKSCPRNLCRALFAGPNGLCRFFCFLRQHRDLLALRGLILGFSPSKNGQYQQKDAQIRQIPFGRFCSLYAGILSGLEARDSFFHRQIAQVHIDWQRIERSGKKRRKENERRSKADDATRGCNHSAAPKETRKKSRETRFLITERPPKSTCVSSSK